MFLGLYDKAFEDTYTFMKLNLTPKMQLLECNYIVQVRLGLFPAPTALTSVATRRHLEEQVPGGLGIFSRGGWEGSEKLNSQRRKDEF